MTTAAQTIYDKILTEFRKHSEEADAEQAARLQALEHFGRALDLFLQSAPAVVGDFKRYGSVVFTLSRKGPEELIASVRSKEANPQSKRCEAGSFTIRVGHLNTLVFSDGPEQEDTEIVAATLKEQDVRDCLALAYKFAEQHYAERAAKLLRDTQDAFVAGGR